MYRTILAPLDGSENAERILPWLDLLRGPGSALRLLRVVPDPRSPAGSLERTLAIEAESYLEFLAAELGTGVSFEIRRGEVAGEILAAGSAGGDLIALSAIGASAAPQRTSGAIALEVILAADRPVLVLPAGAPPPQPRPAGPLRVLVGLDGTPESESVLGPARQAAGRGGAVLMLLHVIERTYGTGGSEAARLQAAQLERTRDRLRELAAGLAGGGVESRTLLVRGDPGAAIAHEAARRRADLIALSTARRGALGRLVFGAVTEKVIARGTVPVLVVPRGARDPR